MCNLPAYKLPINFRAKLYPRFCPQSARLAAPALFRRHLSRSCCQDRRCVACRVLLDAPAPLRRDPTAGPAQVAPGLPISRTHSPCSPLHARPAGAITAAAGRLLPYPFTPGRFAPVGILSVAVVVAARCRNDALTCCFVRQRPQPGSPSRAGVGKFLYRSRRQRRLTLPFVFNVRVFQTEDYSMSGARMSKR